MPIFVRYCHLLQDLLDIFVGGFHCAIHLWSVWRRIVMLNPELHAEFCDHSIVKIGAIVCDDPLGYAILTYKVILNELGHKILGNGGEGSCFDPFCKIVNGH